MTQKQKAKRAGPKVGGDDINSSMVARAYDQILEMINDFRILPGERLNEVEIAKKLGVSRTPLREALNRLAIEGFLKIQMSKGFFCREISPEEIFQLYQFRTIVEVAGARIATNTATDEALAELKNLVEEATAQVDGGPVRSLVEYDERFHEVVMTLSGNAEMLRVLKNLNQRLRPMRWIDLRKQGGTATQHEHRLILAAFLARDEDEVARLMEQHIARTLQDVDGSVRQIYGDIYVNTRKLPAWDGAI